MRTLAAALVLGFSLFAFAGAPGTIVVSAQADGKPVKVLKAQDGQWTLFFVAYLKKPTGAPEINVVFYDTKEKGEPVNVFQIGASPEAKGVSGNLSFGKEQGFKPGHTYEMRVTLLAGGKEEIFARTTLSLK